MSRLLAIDTSGDACSAALRWDGETRFRWALDPRGHARRLLPMVEDLLAEAGIGLGQLDALAFGRGPGSFTGLRIGCAVVQGLAFAADRPVVPVSSLRALAEAVSAPRVAVAFDARMGEVYWATYRRAEDGRLGSVGSERVASPGQVALPGSEVWEGVGEGWRSYADALPGGVTIQAEPRWPHAREVALLGEWELVAGQTVPASRARPVYLRDRVVHGPEPS